MTLLRIEELTSPPVVGQEYLVPCVWEHQWWPVTGPLHEDADLGVAAPHYHFDTRFLSATQLAWNVMLMQRKTLGMSLPVVLARDELALLLVHRLGEDAPPQHMVRVCEREALTFPEVAFLPGLERKFKDSKVKRDCRTCPHRGVHLASLPVNEQGGVVCSGHGLQWHHETGRLMPRSVIPETGWKKETVSVSSQLPACEQQEAI